MKRLSQITICCFLAAILLTGCQSMDRAAYISGALGIDFSPGAVTVNQDSYGGFFGDGLMAVTVSVPDVQKIEQQFSTASGWHPFPLPENLTTALFGKATGNESRAPLFRDDTTGAPLTPEIRNGWYYFYDRHPNAQDPRDPSNLFSRPSCNCTVAVFDTDTGMLYYFELDT